MSQSASLPSSAPTFLQAPGSAVSAPVRKPRDPASLGVTNLEFAEAQLESYLRDRNSVSPDWRDYFDDMRVADSGLTPESLTAPFQAESIFRRSGGAQSAQLPCAWAHRGKD